MQDDVVIRCSGLGKTYVEGKLRTPVFDGLQLEIGRASCRERVCEAV